MYHSYDAIKKMIVIKKLNKREPLIIKYNIRYPKTLNNKEIKLIKKIFGYSSIEGNGSKTEKIEDYQKKHQHESQQNIPECVHQ